MSESTQPGSSEVPASEAATFEESGNLLKELEYLKKENSHLRKRIRYLESERSKGKPSKWSKVKGALGWEKDKDEKDSPMTLKVPDRVSSDPSSSYSVSPAGSCISHSSLTTPPPPLSSSSSEEDIIQVERPGCSFKIEQCRRKNNEGRRSKSLDGESTLPPEDHVVKKTAKGNKTPWSKVKGIINTKAVKKRSASQEERWTQSNLLHESGETEEHSVDEEQNGTNSLATPKLTVTLPSNEELSTEPGTKKHGWTGPSNKLDIGDASPGLSRKSKWFKVRNVFLQGSRSAPASPVRSASFTYEIEADNVSSGDVLEEKEDYVFQDEEHLKYEIEASYIQLQNKLEEEMSKKYCREVNLSPEFKKKLEEWDKMKLQVGTVTMKDWEQDKDRKRAGKWSKATERFSDKADDEKGNKKSHSREGSFKKQQTTSGGRQEVLIPTSTGTFRFEGISDNFTRKLYEWEQARGIAPEASTFALLGPEYQPSFSQYEENGNGGIARSKSIGSIADLGQIVQSLVQQPSSLSLNDMDELSHCEGIGRMNSGEVERPEIIPRGPLFSTDYAIDNIPRAISDSSNEEKEETNDNFRDRVVSSSFQLLQDNITLLDKLKKERDVCRQLEDDMRTLEGQITSVSKSFSMDTAGEPVDPENGRGCFDDPYELGMCYDSRHLDLIEEEIQCHHSSPLRDCTNMPDFGSARTNLVDDEATQTTYSDDAAYHVCNGFCTGDGDSGSQSDAAQRILSELQDLARRLELTASNGLSYNEPFSCGCQRYTAYSLPEYCVIGWRDEVQNMAKLMDDKIQALRRTLNSGSETPPHTECNSPPPMQGGLHRTMAHENLSPGEINAGEFRSSSGASSSSSFSYLLSHGSASSNRHLNDWSSTYTFPNQLSHMTFEGNATILDNGHRLAGSFTDVSPDGDLSESLRINAPNVFVPTMRKIFSPVSDSEAVELIIDEEDEASESDKDVLHHQGEEDDDESGEDDRSARISENKDEETQTQDVLTSEYFDENVERDCESYKRNVSTSLVPGIKLRAKSSSPAMERKTAEFSSVHFYFPMLENGVVTNASPPEVEELKLGEELTSSLRMRSLKLKKAKEEFLTGCTSTNGSMTVIVDEDVLSQSPNGLMVKSASEEVVAATNLSPEEPQLLNLRGQNNKMAGLFSLPRMKRRWSKDKTPAGASPARSTNSLSPTDDSDSHSCPNTPTPEKKTDSSAASWIKNPAKKLFRPKGKYTINN